MSRGTPSLYQVSLGGGMPTAGQSRISVRFAMTVGSRIKSCFLIRTGTENDETNGFEGMSTTGKVRGCLVPGAPLTLHFEAEVEEGVARLVGGDAAVDGGVGELRVADAQLSSVRQHAQRRVPATNSCQSGKPKRSSAALTRTSPPNLLFVGIATRHILGFHTDRSVSHFLTPTSKL